MKPSRNWLRWNVLIDFLPGVRLNLFPIYRDPANQNIFDNTTDFGVLLTVNVWNPLWETISILCVIIVRGIGDCLLFSTIPKLTMRRRAQSETKKGQITFEKGLIPAIIAGESFLISPSRYSRECAKISFQTVTHSILRQPWNWRSEWNFLFVRSPGNIRVE